MKRPTVRAGIAMACIASALGGCSGGGDGDAGSAAQASGSADQPSGAMMQFVKSLMGGSPDNSEPAALGSLSVDSSESNEPEPVS